MTITTEITKNYPHNCRVYLGKCSLRQYDDVLTWINTQEIPCTWTGSWSVCMSAASAEWLVLRWA